MQKVFCSTLSLYTVLLQPLSVVYLCWKTKYCVFTNLHNDLERKECVVLLYSCKCLFHLWSRLKFNLDQKKRKKKKRIFCTFFGVFFSMCTINCFLANRTFNRELVCNCFKWSPYIPLGQKIEHWSYESGFCFCKKQRCTF